MDILTLAAGVESNTIHPIGKAIVEAAQALNCTNVKVFFSLHGCPLGKIICLLNSAI